MPSTLHICLVSSQLQPNVIPWLELKPQHTLLLASDRVDAEARQLLKIARELGLKADRYPTVIPTQSYEHLREYFLALATDLPTDTDIFINLTGGTKLMALAAADVLAGEGYRFFYTDTDNRRIEFLNLNKTLNTPAPHEFSSSLNIAQSIACGMASISNTGTRDPQQRRNLLSRLNLINSFTRAAISKPSSIGTLNWQIAKTILSKDGNILKQQQLKLDNSVEKTLRPVLSNTELNTYIPYNPDTATISFGNAEQARWLHGIWLEEYVWHQMRAAGLQQYDTGVDLQWHLPEHKANRLPANEIDAIAVYNNRLCVVECKTAKLQHSGKQDILHKLSRLSSQLAGPFGKSLLVSLHAPSNNIADRARHSNITIVCGQQLLNLKQTFNDWMHH